MPQECETMDTTKGVGAFVRPLAAKAPTEFRKVLIVDDDPATQGAISRILGLAGYDVTHVANGAEALEVLQRGPPDFIINDWDMPVLSGAEFCRLVRLGELPHYVYIVMLAGMSAERLVEGLSSGADDFITKPVKSQELLARMQAGMRVLELEKRLRSLASYDPLTELLNRRAFFDAFEKESKRSRRTGCPLSCAMIDVDRFKNINDTYGHLVGDAALKSVARVLKEWSRDTDYIGRYGGEEFAALLPDTNEQGAVVWAERLRYAIAGSPVFVDEAAIPITVSVGVAQQYRSTDAPEKLLDRTDQALFEAKRSGRNLVVAFGSLLSTANA